MSSVTQLLDKSDFLRTLFEAVPCGILVVDQERRVQAINEPLKQAFGLSPADIVNQRTGDVLGCVNAGAGPDGCGTAESCVYCGVKEVANDAFEGKRIHRKKTCVTLRVDGEERELVLLVSAAPVRFAAEEFAVVMMEDISELERLRTRHSTVDGFAGIVGRDPRMLAIYETIRDVANAKVPVLIQGESGTGKELVAAAIHDEGVLAKKNFVPINCGALPEGLLESELFGHVRGAFTGAIRDKKGRFELADDGTIFLDEVADLTPTIQVKLLRVLQEGTFERVGGEETIQVNVRVISATNKDLHEEVAAGRFREDLFYRLCVVPIEMPPLRERRSDIPMLAEHILKNALAESGRNDVAFDPEIFDLMMDHDWPGNVREMQNAIQYALIKCRGRSIEPRHLPPAMSQRGGAAPSTTNRTAIRPQRTGKLTVEAVAAALEETNGNKVKAAKRLAVGRATLYRFLDQNRSLFQRD